ncbi:SKI2 antiviral-like helicase [Fusarium heterosporum]|uniref:SKI2 antiviral-like helicase n=1 Tax=Fusarium heterosporum TaxID=42747 RepID=A0A8H5SZ65_FUSHE|nr:SKI2 antiviral-like helicase [Fusarium heterosporum]
MLLAPTDATGPKAWKALQALRLVGNVAGTKGIQHETDRPWNKDIQICLLRLPVPSLDEGDGISLDLKFVPPVAALEGRALQERIESYPTEELSLVCELRTQDALPAIVFNYNRSQCEQAVKNILLVLKIAENGFNENDEAYHYIPSLYLARISQLIELSVEMLSRQGYLRLVVATGTLALGINMPCKTFVFGGDSVFLSSQNYQHASGHRPDRTLPLTKISVGPRGPPKCSSINSQPAVIGSPFAALSGFTDDFKSIKDLCSGVRDGVFLEEFAIPYIPIWLHDADTEFNAYLYNFFKHGSLNVLVRDNDIRQGDAWFHLKDFFLTLKPILTSLKGVVIAQDDYEIGALDEDNVQGGTEEQDEKAET